MTNKFIDYVRQTKHVLHFAKPKSILGTIINKIVVGLPKFSTLDTSAYSLLIVGIKIRSRPLKLCTMFILNKSNQATIRRRCIVDMENVMELKINFIILTRKILFI